MCGNAVGELVPPYVVYKSSHMWNSWCLGGPPHTKYNRTKSGWFDSITFESWFEECFLVHIRNKAGPFVLIGDNLSSHISQRVLSICKERNIRFVCLPPNTTHISQPLDVAFFAPMKKAWREILTQWKEPQNGSKYATIPKELFPSLLKLLMEKLQPGSRKNLISGFRKCGIWPCTADPLLQRLPNKKSVNIEMISESFLTKLEQKSAGLDIPTPLRRKKKLDVPAGKAISAEDVALVTPAPPRSKKPRKK